ncbi:MAG TPA: hypothetical protein VD927_03025, partial [Chryseosolibacter sp.]|nr:hypothetical protein [Chryseosolibacter sp.]
ATLSGLVSGTYVMKLQVKDNRGTSGYDYIKIVVKNATASIQYLNEEEATQLAMLDTNDNAFSSLN